MSEHSAIMTGAGLPLPGEATVTIPRSEEIPVFRLVSIGFCLTLVTVLGLRVVSLVVDRGAAHAAAPEVASAEAVQQGPADAPAVALSSVTPAATPKAAPRVAKAEKPALPAGVQRLHVRAVEPTRMKLTRMDGEPGFAGVLPGGESRTFESEDVLVLDVADLTNVVLKYNGERLEPLHRLSARRRLVFHTD